VLFTLRMRFAIGSTNLQGIILFNRESGVGMEFALLKNRPESLRSDDSYGGLP